MQKRQTLFTIISILTLLFHNTFAQEAAEKEKNKAAVPQAAGNPVTGSGTPGQLTKWTGVDGSNSYTVGNSSITEDKFGNVGVGTKLPTSKLTVAGIIQSSSGGFKFPDGTIQTTSAAGALFSVAHDATLVGNGTVASPLGVAPSFVSAIIGEPFQQQVNVTIPNNALLGTASIIVPGNKRLLIEFVSASCRVPSPGFLLDRFEIESRLGGQTTSYQFAAVRTFTFGGADSYVANQQVVIHADPGSTITFAVNFPTTITNAASARVSISGRLFDAP
jgi:hypothetical protein